MLALAGDESSKKKAWKQHGDLLFRTLLTPAYLLFFSLVSHAS
jgi:hypothetical protein